MPKRYDYIITNNYDKEMILDILDTVKDIVNKKEWNTENKKAQTIRNQFKKSNTISLNELYSINRIEANF